MVDRPGFTTRFALLPAAAAMDDLLREILGTRFRCRRLCALQVHRVRRICPAAIEKSGVAAEDLDEGCIVLGNPKAATSFVAGLAKLRVWGREPNVKMP